MLKITNNEVNTVLEYLNKKYPSETDVFIHLCEDYDTIQTPDGGVGFGVFVKPENNGDIPHIYIACDIPNDEHQLTETIAHEYKHFLQWRNGEEFDEKEAESFAKKVVEDLWTK